MIGIRNPLDFELEWNGMISKRNQIIANVLEIDILIETSDFDARSQTILDTLQFY